MKKKILRPTATVLTLAMSVSMLTAPIAAANPSSSPFKDVGTTHWGLKDMVKLNLRGVVTGYVDGSFQPEKPVSQMEALLMTVRNMGIDDQIQTIDTNQELPIQVPEWVETSYKSQVLYALEAGLINPSENSFDAGAKASRAWVAQLLVRAIDKDAEAQQAASITPSVNDAASIPTWAVGYVNTGMKYRLLTGYPDMSFRPNQNVTRAELVALLSRSEQYFNLSSQLAIGKITSITGANLNLDVAGQSKLYTTTANTLIYDAKGKATSLITLKKDDAVKVVLNGTSVAYIEILAADAVVNTLKGTILQVLPKDRVVVIKDANQKIHSLSLSNLATISTTAGNTLTLDNLAAASTVELHLNGQDAVLNILVQTSSPIAGPTSIIYDINAEQKLIIVKNSAGKIDAFQYSDQVVVKANGLRFPGVKDLQAGDEIKLKLENNVVTEIELVKAKQLVNSVGKVLLISVEQKVLTLQKDDGTVEAYNVADNVQVNITGLANATLSNVVVNDRLDLTVEGGKVTSITVKDRAVSASLRGTVAAVDTNNRIITIKTDKDELKAYEVNSRAEFYINERSTSSLSEVKKDMKVTIQLADNKVVYLETKNSVDGTITSLDAARKTVTVTNTDGAQQTCIIASKVDVKIEGDSSPELSDLTNGDVVELHMEDGVVTKINVQRAITYRVTGTYSSYKELKVVDKNNNSRYLTVNSRVTVTIPGKTTSNFDEFVAGNVVKATFMGNTLTKVELLPSTQGKITGINTTSNNITLQLADGTSTTIAFNASSEIQKGSEKLYQLSSLTVGDRVDVKDKPDGGKTITLMQKESGKFTTLTEEGKKLRLYLNPITAVEYTLATKVYVHSGTQTINIQVLNRDDQIEIYLLDNIIYEVEKK